MATGRRSDLWRERTRTSRAGGFLCLHAVLFGMMHVAREFASEGETYFGE